MTPQLKEAPNYREAYPAFNVVKCAAAMERGRDLCVFKLGERRIGHIEVQKVLVDASGPTWLLTKQQIIAGTGYLTFGDHEESFKLRSGPTGVGGVRHYVVCPECSQRRTILFWKAEWKCANCQRLISRSQSIDRRALLWERKGQLEKEVRGGRPRGMHTSTYLRKLEALETLREQLPPETFRVAAREHSWVVSGRWMSVEEDHEWRVGMDLD